MSRNRLISGVLTVVCFGIMILWDIYPALTPEEGDTISELSRDISTYWYSLPFVFGILPGHFFFNREDRSTRNIPVLWVLAAILLARDIVNIGTFDGGMPISFVLGVIAGAVWWPQAPAKEREDAPDPHE